MTRKRWIAAAATLGMAAGSAAAQTAARPEPTTLTLTAEGRASREPDVAVVSGGVVTAAPTAAEAMSRNSERMTRVVEAIRKAGIAPRDIQTTGLSLQPQYRYDNNQPPVLTGYQATNTVSLKLRKLGDAGRLLDTLVAQGANQLNGPDFQVENADAALDEARAEAVRKGRARAELYAAAAGLKVKRILSISEGGAQPPMPRPMLMKAAMADAAPAPPPPVEPGEVALSVSVTMMFELE